METYSVITVETLTEITRYYYTNRYSVISYFMYIVVLPRVRADREEEQKNVVPFTSAQPS
jgi:hypothetical protein